MTLPAIQRGPQPGVAADGRDGSLTFAAVGGTRETLLIAGALGLVALIALLDFWTGPYLSFGIFYLIPVAAGAWWGGLSHGILITLGAAVAWHAVDSLENPLIPVAVGIWNGITRFAVLVLTSSLVSRLHTSILREQLLARTDPLTGAANARTFYETVSLETARACRSSRPLTLAYFDLDNFKQLNDRMGHAAGDKALIRMVQAARANLRKTDLLARLGGDEFAILLPDTGSDVAGILLRRIQGVLCKEMDNKACPVTVSIGAITFRHPTWEVDLMIQQVDALMYRAKKKGKARIELAVVQGNKEEPSSAGERRSSDRVLCNRPAFARPEGSPQEEVVTVRDVSTQGVGLLLDKPFPLGTQLAIEPLTHGAIVLHARVVRAHAEEGGWVHGCELATPLRDDDLRGWCKQGLLQSEPRSA